MPRIRSSYAAQWSAGYWFGSSPEKPDGFFFPLGAMLAQSKRTFTMSAPSRFISSSVAARCCVLVATSCVSSCMTVTWLELPDAAAGSSAAAAATAAATAARAATGIVLQTVGTILMIVGILGLILSLIYTFAWSSGARARRGSDYYDRPPPPPRDRY